MDIIDASRLSAAAITTTKTLGGSITASGLVPFSGIMLGSSRLDFGDGKLTFRGDADEAARIFIDNVIALYDEDMRRLRALESR